MKRDKGELQAPERGYLRASRASLWATPVSAALFLGIAWLADLILDVPSWIYWLIAGLHAFTWLLDLLNVLFLQRKARQSS